MPREKAQAVTAARPKVPMRRLGAHCLVVAMKRGNARGAKGVGHQRWIGSTGVGSTGSGRNLIINGRRQPSHGGTSRMMREYHVRICEGLGVQLPGSTRHLQTHAVQRNPTSLDNLVGAGKQHRCHCKSERFGGLQVDDQLELGRRLHWKTSHCDIDTDDGSAATSNRYTSALSGTCAGVPPDRVGSADGVRSRGQSPPNAARLCC